MKDLDFDELDKAVNSLMAGVSTTPAQPGEPQEKTIDVPSSTAASPTATSLPTPAASTSVVPPSSTSPEVPPAVSSRSTPLRPTPASRRGGRFMDVVHPSSDMKKPETPRSVSREGASLQPTVTPPSTESDEIVSPKPVKPEPVTTSSSDDSSAVKSDWPDPLDMANFTDKDDKQDVVKMPPKQDLEVPEKPVPEPDEEAPLVSPFLPDMKVEKRPLGTNSSAEETDSTSLPIVVDEDDQLPATTEDTKPLLPEELHSDLIAIESDTTEPRAEEVSEPEVKKAEPIVVPKSPEPKDEPKKPSVDKERDVPAGPGSIPQQYREEPASGAQESGAIYDTDAYHQPLSHPAKQKSGWMWVVWIILILVVGAGGGAALYFLKVI